MTSITQKNNSYIVHLQTNPNIDMTQVYNQSFFSIFPLKGLRIFKDNIYEDTLQKDDANTSPEKEIIKTTSDDNDMGSKIIDTFGPETTPNSYTELPLQPNTSKDSVKLQSQDENDSNDDSFYSNLTGYLTKYLPNTFSRENNSVKGMKILVPYDVNYPVYLFDDYILSLEHNTLLDIEKSSLKYDDLHILLRDLFVQIEYLKNVGYTFDKFNMNKIVKIRDRFVYLDSENIILYKKDNSKNLHKAFLNLLRDLLQLNGDDEVCRQIKTIEHTQLYYFIKRIEREGIMLWM
jgi:hypothetical protein